MGQSFYILSLVKVIISDSNRIISAQKVMDFQPFIDEYKEGDAVSSPIWIWFIKEDNSSKCQICSQTIARKASCTTGMVSHLKHHHGFLKKPNAWKTYEELSAIKDNRKNSPFDYHV